ncbi:MAG: hypothetical protein V3T86_08315 [Planctomycetota bacterium]
MSRKVEVFISGCALCEEAVELVRLLGGPSCEIEVRHMGDAATLEAARALGVRQVPAVAVDGVLLDCSQGGVDKVALEAAGVGTGRP